MLSSNTCVGPPPRTNTCFYLLLVSTDELSPTPKIITFLHQSKLGYEKSERESLVNLTAPNNQS